MCRVALPEKIERARYITILCAAKRVGGMFGGHLPDDNPSAIDQSDIDHVANIGMPMLNLFGDLVFPDDETAVWFKMKYL